MNELNKLLGQVNTESNSLTDFLINIGLVIVLSLLLGMVYSKFGSSLSNRKKLAESFVLISLTTMIIITIVKSSLALSLGLVGALSIVRFRTAIKEPEELAYFFISIALGLGLGANQRVVCILGVIVILLYIIIKSKTVSTKISQQNLIIRFTAGEASNLNEAQLIDTLKPLASKIDLKRFDLSKNVSELSLNVEFDSFENILKAKNELSKLENLEFSFIENI